MKSLLFAIAFSLVGVCHAQSWPSKPVRVVVNVAAGGVADVTARLLSARMTETLGQSFVVDNRAGGDGYIGFDAVSRADADGHTLLYSPGSAMMIAPHLVDRPDLDPLKTLAPIAATGRVSLYVIAHPEQPYKTFKEFLAYARANPDKLHYGTPGRGTSPHIATEVFNREARVKLSHIPYKGAGPALQAVMGGQIQVVFDPGVGIAPAKAGKVRMIAIAGPSRHPDFPDVPTLEENGIKGVDGGPHFGYYAPSATPREVIAKINSEVQKAMQHELVKERFRTLAVDVAQPMSPEQFAAYVRGEHARYAKLIPELGIKGGS
jgi:tripartite-type tricarboxylate transporter receptor subunit TctC